MNTEQQKCNSLHISGNGAIAFQLMPVVFNIKFSLLESNKNMIVVDQMPFN